MSDRVRFLFEFIPTGFDEYRAIREDDSGGASIAVIDLHHKFCGFLVAFKLYIEIRNIIGFEEFLGTVAVRTELGCVHYDL